MCDALRLDALIATLVDLLVLGSPRPSTTWVEIGRLVFDSAVVCPSTTSETLLSYLLEIVSTAVVLCFYSVRLGFLFRRYS